MGREGPGTASIAPLVAVSRKGWQGRGKREGRVESEELSTHRGLLPLSLSWKESGRRIPEWSVQLGAFPCPESRAPAGGQVCAPGAAPEPSLTMAKVKELCLPKVQLLPQRAWGQSPYCSHYLHLTGTWKVGLLWLPTPDQLHPLPRPGPSPCPPTAVLSSPSAPQGEGSCPPYPGLQSETGVQRLPTAL